MDVATVSFGEGNRGIQVVTNNGTITQHLPPERPETPPNPLSTVPFRRDPDFVNRDTLLEQIHKKSTVIGSRIALVGIDGVGKSQLSIEYSYRIRCQSSETWVFWVYASNAARFEQSFWEIANRLKLPGRRDPAVNIFQLVENWLQDERKGKWLLILDNVDDDKFLRQPPAASEPSANSQQGLNTSQAKALTKPLINFIPQTSNGSIIITS